MTLILEVRVDETGSRLEVIAAMKSLPLFSGRALTDVQVSHFGGGQHNQVFKVELGSDTYALRLGKTLEDEPGFYKREFHNATIAARCGVGADILHFNTEDGLLLTRFIDGTQMTKPEFADLGSVERTGLALANLHGSSNFENTFNIFERIDVRETRIDASSLDFPDEADKLRHRMGPVRELLQGTVGALVPCHNDGIPPNYIDTGTQMRIIDWQCAGQGDPHWELGALCVQAGLKPPHEDLFLRSYFDGTPDPYSLSRIHLYKVICAYYWMVWYHDRVVRKKPDRDLLLKRANMWMGKAKQGFDSPDYVACMEAVKDWA